MRFIALTLLLASFASFAQTGTIRGTVIEDSNGEPLFGVTVQIKGTTNGAITDFDGKFEIKAAPGSYDLQASFVSFQTVTISGLGVSDGEVTLIDQIRLKEDVELLEEVVVTAEVIKTTEAALITVKRKSANLIDGISAASFRKIGDNDAASAAKRITGVSIEGGKYVYVRGLGDRYTKTLLNGMDVPGLDPDKNAIQMDIFPTNVLDNIIVSKTFTADLPADFTGGMVDIQTKDIPDIKSINVQAGISFNPSMHFNSDFRTYEGSSTDWLGFDNGTRELHIGEGDEFLDVQNPNVGFPDGTNFTPAQQEAFANQLRGFSGVLGSQNETSFMNYNLGFSAGNQLETSLGRLGYNFATTYRSTTEFYENSIDRRWYKNQDRAETEFELVTSQIGPRSIRQVLLGGLGGVSLKRQNSKYKLNLLRLQDGTAEAGFYEFIAGPRAGTDVNTIQSNLDYSQRSLTNALVSGEHYLDTWKINWKYAPTLSKIDDPDVRDTKYETLDGGGFSIGTGNSGLPRRIWRELEETNQSATLDFTKELALFGKEAKVKFGSRYTFKNRDFSIREWQLTIDQNNFDGSFNELWEEANLWPNDDGNYHTSLNIGGNVNQYEASSSNLAFYVSSEISPIDNLKAIIGVRSEDYEQKYTGLDGDNNPLGDTTVIDEFNFFPSVNLTYALSEKTNLRLAYNRTIARYSLKEASYIRLFDPKVSIRYIGSLNPFGTVWDGEIRSTLIDNFDIRWETFMKPGETVSISAFYKKFDSPIEVVQIASPGLSQELQARNVADATVFGLELEVRKGLGFITSDLQDVFFNSNITFSRSQITMSQSEFDSRVSRARDGESIDRERELQGQSPYIINAGFAYDKQDKGLELGLYYNVQGQTLTYTGIADASDVYRVPFHSLNFSANKTLGKDGKTRVTFRVNNILGDDRELEFQNFGATDQLFSSRSPGTSISIGVNYALD